MDIINWLSNNWISLAVPIMVFLAFFIVSIWARKIALVYLTKWRHKAKWEGSDLLIRATKNPFLHWCLILGAYIAIMISVLPMESKYERLKSATGISVTRLSLRILYKGLSLGFEV